MIKVLIWRISNDTTFQDNALKILERQHDGIEVVGSSTGDDIGKVDWGGVYDILLVVGANKISMSKVTQDARRLNLPEEKLLGDRTVCVPGFTLEKYRNLQESHPSIFSRQCFGGCVSNMLGLPFRSPFVNLFLSANDFIKFLRAPNFYFEKEPHFEKLTGTSKENPAGYPVLSLGDITLNMMHYKEKDEAISKWNERKQRINWDNLVIICLVESEELLEQFDALPYDKKICFVPFESDLDSAWYVNPKVSKNAKRFPDIINNFGWGYLFLYDLFDMLLYGKKTPLIEM